MTSPPPPPRPPPAVSFPSTGVWVLKGSARDATDGDCVTDASATDVDGTAISAQCCERDGTCRRWVGSNSPTGCIAGKWGHSSYVRTTFERASELCSAQGLELCDKSCRGKGCNYDRGRVWTSLTCGAD